MPNKKPPMGPKNIDESEKRFESEILGSRRFDESVFSTLQMAFGPYAIRIFVVLFAGFLGRLLLLGSSNVIGIWVDRACKAPLLCRPVPAFFSTMEPHDFIWLLSLMAISGFILTVLFRTLFSRLSARAVSQIYDEVTWRTSRFSIGFFDKTPAGRIITRFSSDYGNVFRLFGGPLAEFIAIVFDLLVMVLLMGFASPYFLIFVAIIILINFAAYRLNRNQLRVARRKLSSSRSPSIAHFSETAQAASTVRSFSKELPFTNRFVSLDKYYLDRKLETVKVFTFFSFQMNMMSALLFLLTGLTSISLLAQGRISLGSLGVAFGLIVLSGNTVQMFFEWLAQFEEAMIGVERLDDYLRRPLEPGSFLPAKSKFETVHPRQTQPDQAPKLNGAPSLSLGHPPAWVGVQKASVEFKDVNFRYHDQQPWILQNLNFKVEAGEHLGIIGSTGSGKSTLIQVLFHLYPLQKGEILLENQSLKIEDSTQLGSLDSFRRAISYISQDPTLFQGSLRENLDMTRAQKDENLLRALEQVGVSQWSLDRSIEERGKNLSSGERQLLCMARCLLQESPVVIMDEATSFVDPQSEELIVRATHDYFKDRTQIIIAHRLSTLKNCHRILWLDQGRIRHLGPAEEVLQKISADHRLFPHLH